MRSLCLRKQELIQKCSYNLSICEPFVILITDIISKQCHVTDIAARPQKPGCADAPEEQWKNVMSQLMSRTFSLCSLALSWYILHLANKIL